VNHFWVQTVWLLFRAWTPYVVRCLPRWYAFDIEVGKTQLDSFARQSDNIVDTSEIVRIVSGVVRRVKRPILRRVNMILAVDRHITIYNTHAQTRNTLLTKVASWQPGDTWLISSRSTHNKWFSLEFSGYSRGKRCTVWVKKIPPCGFLTIFSKRIGIF